MIALHAASVAKYWNLAPLAGEAVTQKLVGGMTSADVVTITHGTLNEDVSSEKSSLLPPVGVWAVSQSQCGRSTSQSGYRSLPWWAITSPTS